jgi:hypothetical protein
VPNWWETEPVDEELLEDEEKEENRRRRELQKSKG